MKVLVDTSVLIRSVQKSHPACRSARGALASLYRAQYPLYPMPQNVAEFWNVCTRPIDVNGLGLSIEATDNYTRQLEKFFTILPDSGQVFAAWRSIVVDYAVRGAKVHDARLAAAMKVHELENILTFNVQDFTRFRFIEAIHPETVGRDL